MTNFTTLNAYFFILQAFVLVMIISVDYLASAVGTRRFGGSKQAAMGAVIGTIPGLIFLGSLGIVIGPYLGALVIISNNVIYQSLKNLVGGGALIIHSY